MIANYAALQDAATGYRGLFWAGWGNANPHHEALAMQVPSEGSMEEFIFDDGVPEVREWVGEREAHTLKVFSLSVPNKDYELTIKVPRNAYLDDRLGFFNHKFEMAGLSMRRAPDNQLIELLNGAFTGNGYDGVPFISATHPVEGGGTRTNFVDGALDATNFATAFTRFRSLTNWHGAKMRLLNLGARPELVVAPNLEETARGLLLAERLGSGATNTNFGRADLRVIDGLDDDLWFVHLTGLPLRPFIVQNRQDPELVVKNMPGDEQMFWDKEVIHGADRRYAVSYGYWQLIVGGAG